MGAVNFHNSCNALKYIGEPIPTLTMHDSVPLSISFHKINLKAVQISKTKTQVELAS